MEFWVLLISGLGSSAGSGVGVLRGLLAGFRGNGPSGLRGPRGSSSRFLICLLMLEMHR